MSSQFALPYDNSRIGGLAKIRYQGENLRLKWSLISDQMLAFGPADSDGYEMLWFGRVRLKDNPDELSDFYIEQFFNWEVQRLYDSSDFLRLIPLKEGGNVWGIIGLNASGLICQHMGRNATWNANFEWKGDERAFLLAPLARVREVALYAVRNDRDEWQRALNWAAMDTEARSWSLIKWKRGDKEEWVRLVRVAMQFHLQTREISERIYSSIRFETQPPALSMPLQLSEALYSPTLSYDMLRMETIAPLISLLAPYFEATIDYSVLIPARRKPFGDFPLAITLSAEPFASQHELMEAIELWRDFGRESGQLAQVEACLRQLLV